MLAITTRQALPLPQPHREPFPGADPDGQPLQGAGARWREGRSALGGSRTRNIQHLRAGPAASWGTSTWSRHPVPTRATRLTRAGPQPCAAASLGNLDSNQDKRGRLPVQSRACCQLHHSPSLCVRTPGAEPGDRASPQCLQGAVDPGGDARNRTESPTLAGRGRCLSYSSPCCPAGLAPGRDLGCFTLLRCQITGTFTRRRCIAGTPGLEPGPFRFGGGRSAS